MIGRIVMACVVMIGTVVLVWWAWRDLMRALGHAPSARGRLRPGGDRTITLPILAPRDTGRVVTIVNHTGQTIQVIAAPGARGRP